MAMTANSDVTEVAVQEVELESLTECELRGSSILSGNLGMIKNVKVRLDIRVGDARLTVGQLLDLKAGSVIELSQSVTSPVEVLLDGRVVALGELSVVGDNFGVRIREIPG